MSGEHTDEEVPVDDGRYLPIRREVVAPPRRRAITAGGRRRVFTLVVLVWVAVVITVPALALRTPSGGTDAATRTSTVAGGTDRWRKEPFTESPPPRPDPTTTLPDPVAYAQLGLPVPDLSVPPPHVAQLSRTPGVDAPWETSPTTAVPPVTAPPVQVLEQTVGVDVDRTDTSSTTSPSSTASTSASTSAGAEVAGATQGPTSAQSGSLARTGLAPWVLTLLAIGVALVIAGAILLAFSRRRRGDVR